MARLPGLECLLMVSLLPFLLCTTICSGHTTYYIKPTPNTPCPTDLCSTLSEYAQQPLHNLTSNTTLLLLPGDHILRVNFTVEDVSTFEIWSFAPAAADSHATRIVCQGLFGFSFRNISRVAMHGVTISSCGKGGATIYSYPTAYYGVSVHSVLHTSIANCSFQDSVGTALGVFHSSLALRGNNSFTDNCKRFFGRSYTCSCFGGGIYASASTLMFTGNTTFTVNSAALGGGIATEHSALSFNGKVILQDNTAEVEGGGIYAWYSTLNFSGNTTFGNNLAAQGIDACQNLNGNSIFRNGGGGINVEYSTLNFNGSSTFTDNSAEGHGGGIFAWISSLRFSGNNTYRNNSAEGNGGGIFAWISSLNFTGNSVFGNNSAASGGGIEAWKSILNFTGNSTLRNNSATHYGGGIDAEQETLMNFDGNSIFSNNHAAVAGGGILVFQHNTLDFTGNVNFTHNSAVAGGGIIIIDSSVNVIGNCVFATNLANSDGGGIYTYYSTVNFIGNSTFRRNLARIGGGVYAKVSTLSIAGSRKPSGGGNLYISTFVKNSAMIHGGAVYIEDSALTFQGHSIFSGNSAKFSAGGVSSKNSTLRFSGNTHFSSNSGQLLGGGIYGLGTFLYFNGNSSFIANTAARGGGEYLVNSFNFISQSATVTMDNNNATEYGGAVYVEDSDPISYCNAGTVNVERCFLQVDGLFQTTIHVLTQFLPIFFDPAGMHETSLLQLDKTSANAMRAFLNISIRFYNNHAQRAGNAVYGGSVDNCAIDFGFNTTLLQGFLSLNWHVPNLDLEPNSIASDPIQVCLCRDGVINCNPSESDRQMQVYPGQLFKLPVVATGQRDGIVPAVIRAFLYGSEKNMSLAQFQDTQNVPNICTELHYQVHSSTTNNSGTLVLYADGPCSTDGKLLDISLEFLDCPRGFSLNPSEGICECDPRLQKYTAASRCNITERSLERSGEFWVGYDNYSEGLILHPYCPFDYCISNGINITLNDTDKQCDNNRSGLLCGECKSGFSLVLGSSKCLQCSNIYKLLLIPFALAGIALIILLLILKLTVAAGTINALIFYANIVSVNRAIFFPSNQTNILTVFIAWLNLDLGIETCFFDGMDTYVKTWLQFVFPFYVCSLVGLIIIGSEYSSRITRLFGSNPVAVLSTLFLLSYAKFLRTVIATFYFTFLDYPDEVSIAVWLHDGNIVYIHGKLIVLFLVALLAFLILFLPYTFLLTVGQWLQAKSNQRLFHWINSPRLKPFLDAYQAPYRDQHRYWTGLMLCLRCILFSVFAVVSSDPGHKLLAIEVVVVGLLTFIHFTGFIYKRLYLDILEASFIVNLGILAAATYSVRLAEKPESQDAVTYLSVGIAFAIFAGVLVYHTYQQVWPKLQQRLQLHHHSEHQSEGSDTEADNQVRHSSAPTMTIVESPSSELFMNDNNSNQSFSELREPLNLIHANDP